MQQRQLDILVRKIAASYRGALGPLAVEAREVLFDSAGLLGLDPKTLVKALMEGRPRWSAVSNPSSKKDLDLTLRLMSAEEEIPRTLNAIQADSPEQLTLGVKLFANWATSDFRVSVNQMFLRTMRSYLPRLKKSFPKQNDRDLILFILAEMQRQITYSPMKIKDAGLLGDLLTHMVI